MTTSPVTEVSQRRLLKPISGCSEGESESILKDGGWPLCLFLLFPSSLRSNSNEQSPSLQMPAASFKHCGAHNFSLSLAVSLSWRHRTPPGLALISIMVLLSATRCHLAQTQPQGPCQDQAMRDVKKKKRRMRHRGWMEVCGVTAYLITGFSCSPSFSGPLSVSVTRASLIKT